MKKGVARPVTGRSVSPPSSTKVKPKPSRLQSPIQESERARTAAPPLHRPATASSVPRPSKKAPNSRKATIDENSPTRKGSLPRPITQPAISSNVASEPPPKFHAIELSQRKRADDDTLRKRAEKRAETLAENNKGKPFKNLQHQNNMRKKTRDAQYAPPPPPPSRPVTTVESVVQSIEPASTEPPRNGNIPTASEIEKQSSKGETHIENDAAQLFFSDSDEDIKQEVIQNDEDSLLRTLQTERRESTQLSSQPILQDKETVTLPQTLQPKSPREVNISAPLGNARPNLTVDTQTEDSVPATKEAVDKTATNAQTHIIPESAPREDITEDNIHPERRRRNSLFNQYLPVKSTPKEAPTSSTTTAPHGASKMLKSPKAPRSLSEPDNVPSNNSFRQVAQTPTVIEPKMLLKDGHVTRELIRGDLLCHIICRQGWIGAVKFMHAQSKSKQTILHAKEERDKKLLLHFDGEMTREQYNQRSSTAWFSYYDLGLFEPFKDTAVNFMALADHLEQTKSAVFWYHPFEDFMGVLYPCKSPEWRDLGVQQGREYEARLCVAFRPKFVELSLQPPIAQTVVTTQSPVQVTDPRKRSVSITGKYDQRDSIVAQHTQSAQHPKRSIDQPEEREAQDVNMSGVNGTGDTPVADKDAMDVDDQPEVMARLDALVDKIQADRPPVQAKSFPGIDRSLEQLSSVPRPDAEKRKVLMLLVYDKSLESHAQLVKNWLIKNGQPWDQILDINDDMDKSRFYKNYKKDTWVVLFDKRYRIEYFEDFAKFPNKSHYVLCWQFNYQASTLSELDTRNLYPAGVAVCISEASYLMEPRHTRATLRWVKDYASKPYASSALILPPDIIMTLLDEANLAVEESDKRLLTELATMTRELMNTRYLSASQIEAITPSDGPNLQSLEVIETDWEAVYKSNPKDHRRAKSWLEISRQNKEKEIQFVRWFSAWALMNLHRHRKFLELCAVRESQPSKKEPSGHVIWLNIVDYVEQGLPNYFTGPKKPTEKERGRQMARKGEEEGGRSRSVSRGSFAMPTPTTPALR